MRRKEILPIHKPLINHIPADSFLLSIIGEKENELDWIMGNFINLRINPKIGYSDFFRTDMWYNCYFIYENAITRDFILNNTMDIVEFFMNQISNGYYIYTYVNMACIRNYESKENMTHNPLIFGYDQEERIFYLADFFRNGKLSFDKCSFEEVEKAFDIDGLDCKYLLYRFLKKVEFIDFKYEYKNTILQLENYITSKDMYGDGLYHYFTNESEDAIVENVENGFDYIFGLAYYEGLKQIYMKNWDAVKAAQVLVIHKELMLKRIEYFYKKKLIYHINNLKDLNMELIKQSAILRNTIIKKLIYEKKKTVLEGKIKQNVSEEKIYNMIDSLRKKDYIFSKTLLKELSEGLRANN
ncbi:MAG: hypothetical protein HFG97_01820 [Dorea sp.]|nr:hypothetical protein [Dorea sp.]